ncbi:MAG TPA: AAA family ATPase [Gaiellales bacterium]|nr:AAA family ATPase [Gaiellales bacterium]
MRVDRLTVSGFGKLAGSALEPGPGLTVVHGPNESGKSTTHAALRAGLFGLVAGGRRTRDETAAIERHRPWLESRYGAVLELADADGRHLRLEWDFDRSRYTLRDAATGAELTADHGAGTDPRTLARTLYGVDRDVYVRLGCVHQSELDRIGEPGSVRHAVESALTQARADASAATAVEALRAHRSRLVGMNRARTNPLPAAEARAEVLRGELRSAAGERAEVERAAAGRDAARAEADAAIERVHVLESVRDHLRAEELRRRLDAAEGLAATVAVATGRLETETDGAGFAPVEQMAAMRDRMHDLAAELGERMPVAAADSEQAAMLDARCGELEGTIAALEPDRGAADRAAAVEAAAATASTAALPRGAVAAVAFGIVAAVAGVVAGLTPLIGVGVAAVAAGAGWAFTARRGGAMSELDRLLPGDGPRAERLEGFRASVERDRALTVAERELAGVRIELAELRTRLAGTAQLETELHGLHERVATALRGCGIDPGDLNEGLRLYDGREAAAQVHREATLTRTRASEELRRLLGSDSLDDARARLEQLEENLNGHGELASGRRLDDVERDLAAAREAGARASAESERLSATVAERLRMLPDVASLRERADAADEEVARLRHVDHVLRLAEEELAAAAADTYRDFAPQLNASLEAGMDRLTDGRYTHAFVDEDLSVRLEAPETGAVVDLDRLSVGTQKQAYLVQRLELVRLLCPGDRALPVLLDDPFAHFDSARVARTLEWLAEAAAERQIILFSTQRRVAELAPAGATVIAL